MRLSAGLQIRSVLHSSIACVCVCVCVGGGGFTKLASDSDFLPESCPAQRRHHVQPRVREAVHAAPQSRGPQSILGKRIFLGARSLHSLPVSILPNRGWAGGWIILHPKMVCATLSVCSALKAVSHFSVPTTTGRQTLPRSAQSRTRIRPNRRRSSATVARMHGTAWPTAVC